MKYWTARHEIGRDMEAGVAQHVSQLHIKGLEGGKVEALHTEAASSDERPAIRVMKPWSKACRLLGASCPVQPCYFDASRHGLVLTQRSVSL